MNLLVVKIDIDSIGCVERKIDPTALIIRDGLPSFKCNSKGQSVVSITIFLSHPKD